VKKISKLLSTRFVHVCRDREAALKLLLTYFIFLVSPLTTHELTVICAIAKH